MYSRPYQTSKMDPFAKIVNGLTEKMFILDFRQGSEYISGICLKYWNFYCEKLLYEKMILVDSTFLRLGVWGCRFDLH